MTNYNRAPRRTMAIKRIILTSAQMGAPVNQRLLSSLLNLSEKLKAKLQIIPLAGATQKIEDFDESIEKYLLKRNKEYELNSNLAVNTISIKPTQERPLSGSAMKRLATKSLIIGSPKIALEVVPTSNVKLPRIMMTTGAVTQPYYAQTKVGMLAALDHRFGAILVEIIDENLYFARQLEANGNGEIFELNTKYSSNIDTVNNVEALVLGDTHVGFTAPEVQTATEEMIAELKPANLVFHDLLDFYSKNHHHENDFVVQVQKAEGNLDDIKRELEMVADYLVKMKTLAKAARSDAKILVVASNHDEALDRYLREKRFKDDPKNARIAMTLFMEMVDGRSPLEAYIKKFSSKKDKLQDIRFLSRDEDYRIEGIQVANHGDLGAKGARGSATSQELGSGSSIIGHSHSPRIYHGTYQTGTSTLLKLEYNRGFSDWLNCHCIINKGGLRQLLIIINGKWRA